MSCSILEIFAICKPLKSKIMQILDVLANFRESHKSWDLVFTNYIISNHEAVLHVELKKKKNMPAAKHNGLS